MANELQTKLDAILLDKNTNLLPENLKKNVTILGITGILESGGIDTSDATAVANDILTNKTAYVNGEKITGNMLHIENDSIGNPAITKNISSDNGVDGEFYDNGTYFGIPFNNIFEDTSIIHKNPDTEILAVDTNVKMQLMIKSSVLAKGMGLTADKIKSGETILGITGTYTGETTQDLPVKEIDWTNELTNFTISTPAALSSITPDVKTRLKFVEDELIDATTIPELKQHIIDVVIAKIVSGANWNWCTYLVFDADMDLSQIQSNIALDTTGITCSAPACPEDFKTSTSGYKYTYIFNNSNDDAGFEAFKSLIEDGTTVFNISLTDMF